MTEQEAISLAKTHLDEPAKSGASAGDAVRINQDYLKRNAEWLRKVQAMIEPRLGIPIPPIDETATIPHWLVSFTVFAGKGKASELQHRTFRIYDDGRVEQLPVFSQHEVKRED